MTMHPPCITCGTRDQVTPVGDQTPGAYGCPAHIIALRGRLDSEVDAVAWYQSTREQRLRDRRL